MPTAMTPAQIRLVGDTARELEAASACKGERGAIIGRLAGSLGVSVNTAYGYLRRYAGFASGKKPRKGKGESLASRELCRKVAGLVLLSTRANGKRIMSIKRAVEILRAQGAGVADPVSGEITMPSAETISRAMRQYGCHPDQLGRGAPSGQMRSLYPNHVWELDASVCVLYYIRGTGRVGVMDERQFNEKKPVNLEKISGRRVVRYVVTDHASGVFYVRYEQATGENAYGVLQTLISFMSDRGPRDPAHGLPSILYMDPGSGNCSSLVRGFCEQCEIRLIHHAPGAARATGAVEKCQDIVEREFESRQRFHDVPDLAFLQAEADRWRRHFCATAIHSRTKKSRNAAWVSITDEQLRTAPRDVLEAIAAWKDERRPVGNDYRISLDTRTSFGVQSYDLRELAYHGLNPKDSVRLRLNPFKAPAITVLLDMPDGGEKRFSIEPVAKDQYGFDTAAPVFGEDYRALPKSGQEKELDAILMDAYGVQSPEEAQKQRKAGKTPYAGIDIMADVREAPLHLGRIGQPAPLAAPVLEPAPMSRVAFAMMMKREHADVWNDRTAADCMEWLAARFPDSVPGNELEKVIAQLADQFGPRRALIHKFNNDKELVACAQ